MNKKLLLIFVFLVLISFILLVQADTNTDPIPIHDNIRQTIDDSSVYISGFPKTIYRSQYGYFDIQTKSYTGDIDIAFGFNTTQATPNKAELYKPRWEYWNTSHSKFFQNVSEIEKVNDTDCYQKDEWNFTVYVCNCQRGNDYNKYKRNVTYNPKYFDEMMNETFSEIKTEIICFDSYDNISNNYTTYWYTAHSQFYNWKDISDKLDVKDYDYDGKNKWYLAKDIPVVANTLYKIRSWINVPFGQTGKYDVAVKPSIYSISEAIANSVFYFLDPFWDTWNQTGWDLGTFTNTTSNASNIIHLNQTEYAFDNASDGEGMVLWYHFNNDSSVGENDSVVYDFSGQENNGTFGGTAKANATGKFSKGLWLNGSGDCVETGVLSNSANISGTKLVTISVWIKSSVTSPATANFIVGYTETGKGASVHEKEFKIHTDGTFNFYVYSGVVENIYSDSANDGNWHHLVGVYNGTDIYMFVDGVLQADIEPASSTYTYISPQFLIGGNTATNDPFDGTIDELAIYNRSLSADEIASLYRRKRGTYQSEIKDFSSTQSYENLSWTPKVLYQQELPNNRLDERDTTFGGANMSGNVLLMHFNNDSSVGENDSVAYDFSGLGNNGSLEGTAKANGTAKFGDASLWLDGNSDYAEIASDSSLDITGAMSVEAWIKPSDMGTYQGIFLRLDAAGGTGYGYIFAIDSVDRFGYYNLNNGWSNFVTTVTYNEWQHVVFVYNSTNMNVYKNGIAGTSTAVTAPSSTATNKNYVGSGFASTYYFKGHIDEVAIYNRTLSAAEIEEHYLRGTGNISFQVRSCADATCSADEPFIGVENTTTSYFTNISYSDLSITNITDNRYFQYKSYFWRDTDSGDTTQNSNAVLYNVTIGYEAVAAEDTCTPPGTGDHKITDNCTWTTNQVSAGDTIINAPVTLKLRAIYNFTNVGSKFRLNHTNCELRINFSDVATLKLK